MCIHTYIYTHTCTHTYKLLCLMRLIAINRFDNINYFKTCLQFFALQAHWINNRCCFSRVVTQWFLLTYVFLLHLDLSERNTLALLTQNPLKVIYSKLMNCLSVLDHYRFSREVWNWDDIWGCISRSWRAAPCCDIINPSHIQALAGSRGIMS